MEWITLTIPGRIETFRVRDCGGELLRNVLILGRFEVLFQFSPCEIGI